MPNPPLYNIVIPLYDGVNLMDVTAAVEMFTFMNLYWKDRTVKVTLAAAKKTIKTHEGVKLIADTSFAACYKQNYKADLLWVPGGESKYVKKMMQDKDYQKFVKTQSATAAWTTSVCEGALILASAGLLDGFKATTHWAYIPCLKEFSKVKVHKGYPRYVVDGNRVTGGGVSSGLDEALKIVSLISSVEVAKQVQLVTQYFPKPPFKGKIPGAKKCQM